LDPADIIFLVFTNSQSNTMVLEEYYCQTGGELVRWEEYLGICDVYMVFNRGILINCWYCSTAYIFVVSFVIAIANG